MIANSIYKVNYFFSIYYSKNDYMGPYLFLRFIFRGIRLRPDGNAAQYPPGHGPLRHV